VLVLNATNGVLVEFGTIPTTAKSAVVTPIRAMADAPVSATLSHVVPREDKNVPLSSWIIPVVDVDAERRLIHLGTPGTGASMRQMVTALVMEVMPPARMSVPVVADVWATTAVEPRVAISDPEAPTYKDGDLEPFSPVQ
jgi:hypothetical protein